MKRGTRLFDRLSVQKLFLFTAAILVASFALTSVIALPTHAATDATWDTTTSILYNNQDYNQQNDAIANDGTGLPAGTHIYSFTEPQPTDGSPQKVHLIYFTAGSDASKATTAQFETANYKPPSTFTNPTEQKNISITPMTSDTASGKSTSCVVHGIGWIVCPVTDFLAGAMDWLFNILAGFMAVRPVSTGQGDTLFRAWSMMRNFANVAFVVAFLVIIYSQVTTLGISNYGIKKILPRLVAAAILVNISYWICAVAVDISNILGYSIQDIFIAMRNNLVGTQGNGWSVTSFSSVAGFVLSGGTAATALGFGMYAAIGGAAGAIYLLLPILLGVLMAVLIALIVIAARQAVITILIIVSPLAFVAFILPNTEKYYRRWHELGSTMLIMFPAFSVVFGGSQLAGTAIIQNAGSVNMIILGMAVQVAPLAITPLLLRISGSLLNKVAGIVNNPSRGLIDRNRKWAQSRAEDHKNRTLARTDLGRRNFIARSAQNIEERRRKREGWRQVWKDNAENRWLESDAYKAVDTATREAARQKHILEQQHNTEWNVHARLDTRSLEQELRLRVTADQESLSKLRLDAMHEEFKAGQVPASYAGGGAPAGDMTRLLDIASDANREVALTTLRKQAAERKASKDLTQELLANTQTIDGQTLREYAGGIMETAGAESVLASAVAASRKEYNDKVAEKTQLIKHFNLNGNDRQNLAMGRAIAESVDSNGNRYTFDVSDNFAREAAIEAQLGGAGNVKQIEEIIAASGSTLSDYKTTISSGIVTYKLSEKSPYLAGKTIDDVSQGLIRSDADLDAVATRALAQGKIKPTHLATGDKDSVMRYWRIAFNPNMSMLSAEDQRALAAQQAELVKSARDALTLPSLKASVAQNVEPILQNIINGVRPPNP